MEHPTGRYVIHSGSAPVKSETSCRRNSSTRWLALEAFDFFTIFSLKQEPLDSYMKYLMSKEIAYRNYHDHACNQPQVIVLRAKKLLETNDGKGIR